MTTKLDVLNDALVLLGEPRTSSPDSSDKWVRRLNQAYDGVVRRLLEDHPWDFATKREKLTLAALGDDADGDPLPYGRDLAYNKPAGCLRICWVNDSGQDPTRDDDEPDYENEEGHILTNLDPCYMGFVSQYFADREGAWPGKFGWAVSTELASVCAEVSTKSESKGLVLEKKAEKALRQAKSWDAAQRPFRRKPRGSWVRSRSAYGGVLDPERK